MEQYKEVFHVDFLLGPGRPPTGRAILGECDRLSAAAAAAADADAAGTGAVDRAEAKPRRRQRAGVVPLPTHHGLSEEPDAHEHDGCREGEGKEGAGRHAGGADLPSPAPAA